MNSRYVYAWLLGGQMVINALLYASTGVPINAFAYALTGVVLAWLLWGPWRNP